MALIVRMDIDRPYGREPLLRHVMSRVSSDFWLPAISYAGYLKELKKIISVLDQYNAHACAFFRKCTLPSREILALLDRRGHQCGLHLEDSRTYETFLSEKRFLEDFLQREVTSFSKHGSGGAKFGRRHYAPYEPDNYIDWAKRAGMKSFFGNLEDPELPPASSSSLTFFPSAFWLETPWRDTQKYSVDWLLQNAKTRDIVLLIHPENVLASPDLTEQFHILLSQLDTKILQ